MNILLISPNTLTVPYPVYPIGLDYVAGSIDKKHSVKIVDLNAFSLEELEPLLREFSPHIIGLSCRNIDTTDISDPRYFIGAQKKLVTWLKKRSDAMIICGGSGFTIMPERIMQDIDVDYGIIGEGERFGMLVEAVSRGDDPLEIPGVVSSTLERSNPEPWQGERSREFSVQPHTSFYLQRGGMLNLQSKRGCAFRCVYCPYPAIEGRKHRLTDPDEVARMALELEEAGAKYFFITDSAFNSDIDHSLEVAQSFIHAGVSIPWGGFFAPVKLPGDYFSLLAQAGLKHVEFGTESLSNPILKNYYKPFTVEDVFSSHQQAVDAGIHVAHYLLMGGPGESPETVEESLDNLDRLKKTVVFFFFGMRIYPQTRLYDIALREGKITTDTDLLRPVYYEADDIDLATIEKLVLARVGKRINCVVGSGGVGGGATVEKMHEKGYIGPLWEFLIR